LGAQEARLKDFKALKDDVSAVKSESFCKAR